MNMIPARIAALALPVFILSAGFAAAQEISTATVYACAEKAGDAERLACYDEAVGRLKMAEEAGDVRTVTRAEVEQVKKDSFGFSIPSLPGFGKSDNDSEKLEEIALNITGISKNGYGKVLVTLENGQIWEQTDSKKVYVKKSKPPKQAIVKRAAMGSFMVKLDKQSGFRAKRVK